MTNSYEKYQKQIEKQIKDFTRGWDWKRVFSVWKNRIDAHTISLDPLFTEIPIYDPGFPAGRPDILSWWPKNETDRLREELQDQLSRYPGSDPEKCLQGELATLYYLWDCKRDKEKIAAVLIAASLFMRLYSSRRQYPVEYWPPYNCAKELFRWANAAWNNRERGWHPSHTRLFPYVFYTHNDFHRRLCDMADLINHLAEEHALVLSNYDPVVIKFQKI